MVIKRFSLSLVIYRYVKGRWFESELGASALSFNIDHTVHRGYDPKVIMCPYLRLYDLELKCHVILQL